MIFSQSSLEGKLAEENIRLRKAVEEARNMAYRIKQAIYGPWHEQQNSLEALATEWLQKHGEGK